MKQARMKPELEPLQVDFGYGFVVKIVTAEKPIRGADGQWEGVADGTYPMIIRLSPGLSESRRHEVIAHEISHAALDFFQWVLDNLVADLRREELEEEG